MRGDILILNEHHHRVAGQIARLLSDRIRYSQAMYFITVAGESGAGKSETAAAMAEAFKIEGLAALIIQQDDFFVHPPKTNASVRIQTGGKVGPEEVRLDLLTELIRSVGSGNKVIVKPLVIFDEDRITTETIDVTAYQIIIIEGTYTTLLDGVNCRIFIDRDMNDTRADRQKRNRETQDGFLEQILTTEHAIISGHKIRADLTITPDFTVERTSRNHDR